MSTNFEKAVFIYLLNIYGCPSHKKRFCDWRPIFQNDILSFEKTNQVKIISLGIYNIHTFGSVTVL